MGSWTDHAEAGAGLFRRMGHDSRKIHLESARGMSLYHETMDLAEGRCCASGPWRGSSYDRGDGLAESRPGGTSGVCRDAVLSLPDCGRDAQPLGLLYGL